jgi:hypothetical protein
MAIHRRAVGPRIQSGVPVSPQNETQPSLTSAQRYSAYSTPFSVSVQDQLKDKSLEILNMAESWQSIGAKKREQRDELIPKEWRLPAETLGLYHKDAHLSVLDVPRSCGILSAKEIELTEKYDATALLAMLASGEIR